MPSQRSATGALGENAVAAWYEERGYEILARNWRVRDGEIDIVARLERTVVICEVKTRNSTAFGQPFEAVTKTKQLRLRKLAGLFLSEHPEARGTIRFDVASVLPGPHAPKIDVIENAF